jgi:hypothetical protein
MKTAKAQYSEDKKAYDNRTPEQVDAANAAVAAAVSVRHCPPFLVYHYHLLTTLSSKRHLRSLVPPRQPLLPRR